MSPRLNVGYGQIWPDMLVKSQDAGLERIRELGTFRGLLKLT